MMKGYRLDDFTSLDDLRLQEEDDPRLQRGEVLVRVHAVSLNFRDIAMLRRFRPGGDRRVREASRGVEEHCGRLVRHVFLRRGRIFWQKSREEFLKEVRAEMEASK